MSRKPLPVEQLSKTVQRETGPVAERGAVESMRQIIATALVLVLPVGLLVVQVMWTFGFGR